MDLNIQRNISEGAVARILSRRGARIIKFPFDMAALQHLARYQRMAGQLIS
jgi:hypothetical protein